MKLEFWFDFASPYSYLSATRIEELSQKRNIAFEWKPFLLGPIFREQGWSSSPFIVYPAKGKYLWRDLEREAIKYGLKFQKPQIFPQNSVLASRIALAAQGEPWLNDFVRAVFYAEFVEGKNIAEDEVINSILSHLQVDVADIRKKAESPEVKNALREQTSKAASMGIFGAPTFLVGGEMFWGNDRLKDAFDWIAHVSFSTSL